MLNAVLLVLLRYYGRISGGRDPYHYPNWVWALACAFPFIVIFLFLAYNYLLRKPLSLRNIRISRLGRYFKPLSLDAETWLGSKYGWYKELPSSVKARFRSRMRDFLIETDFEARGIVLTEEMTWMMAATYAQLTIGLQHPWMKSIKKVVFDANASSALNRDDSMQLNWHEFNAGFSNGKDGVNEGIRVLASAFRGEDRYRKSGAVQYPYHIFTPAEMKRWNTIAKNEFVKFSSLGLMQGRQINIDDFLSITLVYFFEMPEKLRERHPELYKATMVLMHWDPLRKRIV